MAQKKIESKIEIFGKIAVIFLINSTVRDLT